MTAKCELHPLIHTLLEFNLAQDIGRQAHTKKPPLTRRSQWGQKLEKCNLSRRLDDIIGRRSI